MSDRSGELAYPHLPLLREDRTAARRKRQGYPGPRPNRGGRKEFASQLSGAATRLISERERSPTPQFGIHPHLVFRVPLAEGVNSEQIIESFEKQTGLEIVSVESDGAIIAFRDELNLDEFQASVSRYGAGPRTNLKTGKLYKSTSADFLEFIEPDKMKLWSKQDRIGDSLRGVIGVDGAGIDISLRYIVECELWHPGGTEGGRRVLNELRTLIDTDRTPEERVMDTFTGQFTILAKVAVFGRKLESLLALDVVSEVNLPPKAVFDPIRAAEVTSRDFDTPPHPPENGPRLCIVDSGIVSNHPLLGNNVGHEEAILTQTSSAADANGHGTMVAGLAVFGDVRSSYDNGQFASSITLYSARVLNDKNEFDDEKLIITQMREAIEAFRRQPYNSRVFNSLGSNASAFDNSHHRQTLWAEELDILARELKVLIVVSAGNHDLFNAHDPASAEAALRAYPGPLLAPSAVLCDPATSAIALTVGSLAQRDTPASFPGSSANDIVKPLAKPNEPSPFTRVGPGINGAIKPELVHFGGNLVFQGIGNSLRRIANQTGTSVMSLSHQPTQRLFAYDCGTSFAAPQVSRPAALIEHRLSKISGNLLLQT